MSLLLLSDCWGDERTGKFASAYAVLNTMGFAVDPLALMVSDGGVSVSLLLRFPDRGDNNFATQGAFSKVVVTIPDLGCRDGVRVVLSGEGHLEQFGRTTLSVTYCRDLPQP